MRRHSTIVAGTIAGMAILGAAGPALTGAALAEPEPGSAVETVTPSPTVTPPGPDTGLDVTLTPAKGAPGDSVKIGATAHQGSLSSAVALSPVLGTVKLQTAGKGAEGTGKIVATAKPGVYPVTVVAMGVEGLRLRGGARLIVVTTPTTTPTPSSSPSPSATGTVPSGGIGTGGGGTAGGVDLGLITAGSAIALLGITTAVVAMRRRQGDVHH